MPIAITNFRIQKDFDDYYLSNSSSNYTNNNIVKIIGKIRRSPNDNIVFLMYYGLRNQFDKNKSIKIIVDEDGNFETIINLDEGEGKYYLTARLLLDNGSYDLLTLNCFYKLNNPLINNFSIDNFDSTKINVNTAETEYIINSKNKNELKVNFTAYLDDIETKYFYKLWLSNENEPDFILPLNKNKVNELINISTLTNGEYYLYLKVIDLSSNESFKKIKIIINKISTEVNLNYLQLINKDYYIDLNKETNLIKLLVQVKKGLNIKNAEYRLFENDKILTPKSITEFNKINLELLEQLKYSGFYYLNSFDINTHFDLLDGNYNIQIYYVDIFNKEYNSNKINFKIKSNAPELFTNDLDLNNISTLILSDSNKIRFYLKDDFFTITNKQIEVNMISNGNKVKVNSINNNWIKNEEGIYQTDLDLFLDNTNVNFDGINYKHNIYEFKIENDYYESAIISLPLIYKQKKNIVKLTNSFCFDQDNKINNILNYVNENRNNAQFLIPNSLDFFNINIEIINEVDFEEISNYKTHNNKINLLINGIEYIKDFTNPNEIWLDIKLPDEEKNEDEVYIVENENIGFELFTTESYKRKKFNSETSYFDILLYDEDRFTIENQELHCVGLQEELLVEFPKTLEIKNSNFIYKKTFNDTYSLINFKKQNPFNLSNYKELEFFNCKIYEIGNNQKELDYEFNVTFYKDLSNIYQDFKINNFINNEYFDLLIPYPYEGIEEDLIFEFDCLNKKIGKDLNLLNNSHEYEIVEIENKKYFNFKKLEIVKFSQEGNYNFFCYYKYKNSKNIYNFNIEYDYKIKNNFVKIEKVNEIFNLKEFNYIKINLNEIDYTQINKIEIFYNGINKEKITNINKTELIHKLNNEFLNLSTSIISVKIKLNDLTIINSNILNIKTIINSKILDISMNKNKFIDYQDLIKTRLIFNPYIKSNILIKTKLIKKCGLLYNNQLNYNDSYELILKEFNINKKRYINIDSIIDNNLDNGFYNLCFDLITENNNKESFCISFYISNKELNISKIKFINSIINNKNQFIEIEHNANEFDNYDIYYEINNKNKLLKNNLVEFDENIELQKIKFFIKNKINKLITEFNNFYFEQEVIDIENFKSNFDFEFKEKILIKQNDLKFNLITSDIIYFKEDNFDIINNNENLFIYVDNVLKNKLNILDFKKEILIIDLIDHLNSFTSYSAIRNELIENSSIELIKEFILNNPQKVFKIKDKQLKKLNFIKNINYSFEFNTNNILNIKEYNHLIPCYLKFNSIKEYKLNNKLVFENYYKILNSVYFKDKEFEYHKFYFDLAMIKLKSESIFNRLNQYQKELILTVLIYEFYLLFKNPIYKYDNKILNQLKYKLNVLQVKDIIKILNGVDILNENIYL